MKKLNAKGVSHLLIPIVVVVAVAATGTFMLVSSHASSARISKNGAIKIESRIVSGHTKAHTEYWAKVNLPPSGLTRNHVEIGGKDAGYQGNDWWAINVEGTNKHSLRMKVRASYNCNMNAAAGFVTCDYKSRNVKFEH